jgi:hypothetical protein
MNRSGPWLPPEVGKKPDQTGLLNTNLNSYRVKLDIAPSVIVITTTLIFSREGENS